MQHTFQKNQQELLKHKERFTSGLAAYIMQQQQNKTYIRRERRKHKSCQAPHLVTLPLSAKPWKNNEWMSNSVTQRVE